MADKKLTDCSTYFFRDKTADNKVQNLSGFICIILNEGKCLTPKGHPRNSAKCKKMTAALRSMATAKL